MDTALVLHSTKDSRGLYELKLQRVPRDEPLDGQAVVCVTHAALNRRDHWMLRGMYPAMSFPSVLGADACGVVDGTSRRVVINPCVAWGDGTNPSPYFHLLGMQPAPGCFRTRVAVDEGSLHDAPAHLTSAQASALPLAGLTAFRAVFTKGCVTADSVVLVTGCGGGVATLAVQFAVAAGATVFVTSSSDGKLDAAKRLGAAGGVNYRHNDWHQQLADALPRPLTVVVDGAGGDAYNAYIRLLGVGGRIVVYGGTAGRPRDVDVHRLFLKQASILGTTMGSDAEFEAMLAFVTKHRVVPVVDSVLPMADFAAAFRKLEASDQMMFVKRNKRGSWEQCGTPTARTQTELLQAAMLVAAAALRRHTPRAAANVELTWCSSKSLRDTAGSRTLRPPLPLPLPLPVVCTPSPALRRCSTTTDDHSEADAMITLDSGLSYSDVVVGSGNAVAVGDDVAVHYTAIRHGEDKVLESTWRTGHPLAFTVGDGSTIDGLAEGVVGMRLNGRRLLVIPPHLGDGEFSVPPDVTLVYEVDLVRVGEPVTLWHRLKSLFGG